MKNKSILITGGAGFIGSHVVRTFVEKYPQYRIFNLDLLTYAGNLENLKDIENKSNYIFLKGDITNEDFINKIFQKYQFEGIIHLAAESHVRSISDPFSFAKTNILGTIILLNAFKRLWQNDWKGKRFYHISTDEVFGSLAETGLFNEKTPYDPNSPYSASKASSDHFVRAYGETYGLPYVISNCSNNYGPNHFPEKLIPLFINNIIKNHFHYMEMVIILEIGYMWLITQKQLIWFIIKQKIEKHLLLVDLMNGKILTWLTYYVS